MVSFKILSILTIHLLSVGALQKNVNTVKQTVSISSAKERKHTVRAPISNQERAMLSSS